MIHQALSWHNESSLISWTQSNRGGPLTQQSTNLLLNIQFKLRLVKIYAQPDFWPWVICFTSIDYTAGMTWLARPNRERGERNRHGFIRRQGLLCFSAIWSSFYKCSFSLVLCYSAGWPSFYRCSFSLLLCYSAVHFFASAFHDDHQYERERSQGAL